MPLFTGAAFSLQSAVQAGSAKVRARFTNDPLAANPAGLHDALNPLNWSIVGPGYNAVISVAVTGDPQGFDLFLAATLLPGSYTLYVSNVETAPGDPLSPPTAVPFVAATIAQESVSMGAVSDDAEAVLRKHLNPALKGVAWGALVAAIATGDQFNWDNARLAFDQLFTSTASDLYLVRRAADQGIEKPRNVGISDELFRQYTIKRSTHALTEEALLEILEVFYGRDAVRAHVQTGLAEPYALSDGDDLTILLDERLSVLTIFQTADFAGIGVANAAEVAAAITRSFRAAGSPAYALALVDPVDGFTKVRVYSGALGLASSVRLTGGKAQNALQFEQNLAIASGLPTWTITVNVAAGTTRYQATNPVDLSQLRIGDYVNIFGSPFLAANRGSFPVTDVYFAYTPGLVQWFEVKNSGAAQGPFAQVAASDVLYFRPVRRTVYTEANRAVIVSSLNDEIDVVLPATSQAVVRQAPHAAYGHVADALATISSLVRTNDGIVAVHAPAHGLDIGDQIYVDGAYGDMNQPATNPGDGATTTDARNISIGARLANMSVERIHHASTLARDGRVFVTGGNDAAFALLTAVDIFHVTASAVLADGSTQYTYQYDGANPTNVGVRWHTLTTLTTGKLLKAGGDDGGGGTNAAELCDTTAGGGSGGWTVIAPMNHARYRHTATLLADGRVLVVGGTDPGTGLPTTSCEIFDPIAGTWTNSGSLNVARQHHTATLLPNGQVLVAGGGDGGLGGNSLDSCELFVAGVWSLVGPMARARQEHTAILLPNGQVLAVAGLGQDNTNEIQFSLTACELYDPATTRWRPGPSMIVPRGSVQAVLVPGVNKIYALGDFQSSIEYLDLDRMKWHTSSASFGFVDRNDPTVTLLQNGAVFVAGGARTAGGAQKTNFLLSLPSEVYNLGGLNGSQVVLGVADADHFTYRTPQLAYTANVSSSIAITPQGAPIADGIPGPYILDPDAGLAVTAVVSTITMSLNEGEQYASVTVADATQFPDNPGWLVFDFGFEDQQGPVQYLGRLSNTELALDFGYRFTRTVPNGATITRLFQKGGFAPIHPEDVGSFYVTASPAGRVAAQAAIEGAVGAGVPLIETIVYPGDRGLGGEGSPVSGAAKLSDKVAVWAGDDIDAEVAAAREE